MYICNKWLSKNGTTTILYVKTITTCSAFNFDISAQTLTPGNNSLNTIHFFMILKKMEYSTFYGMSIYSRFQNESYTHKDSYKHQYSASWFRQKDGVLSCFQFYYTLFYFCFCCKVHYNVLHYILWCGC